VQIVPIIDRYILREVVKTLLGFLLVLTIVLFGASLVRYLDKVAVGDVAASILFPMIGLELVRLFGRIIPPAFFFAVLVAIGRMYRDSEVIALESCGVGTLRIFRSVLVTAIPVVAVVAWLNFSVLPWGNLMIKVMEKRASGAVAELAGLEPGRFSEYSKGDLVVFVETLDPQKSEMRNVFVQNREHGEVGLVTAATGKLHVDPDSGARYVLLQEGRRYEGVIGQGDYKIGRFERYGVRIAEGSEEPIGQSSKTASTAVLLASPSIRDQAEAQHRIAQPLATVAFALLSIPLARSMPRRGITARTLVAVLLYAVFLNVLGISQNLMKDEITPQWIGMWWVPALMTLVAGLLSIPQTKWGRRLGRLLREKRR